MGAFEPRWLSNRTATSLPDCRVAIDEPQTESDSLVAVSIELDVADFRNWTSTGLEDFISAFDTIEGEALMEGGVRTAEATFTVTRR